MNYNLTLAIDLPTLPDAWRMIQKGGDGAAYRRRDGLLVMVSAAIESDGKPWVHVSVSRKDKLPSWAELKIVKNLFLGEEAYAYQVFPPKECYVNIHPNVLHLWHCLEAPPLPEFSGFINGVRSI